MANLSYSLDTNTFINGPGDNTPVTSFGLQYGPGATINLRIISGDNLTILPSGYNLNFGFKTVGHFQSGDYVAYTSTNVPDTDAGYYSFNANIYSSGISGLIGNAQSLNLYAQLEYDYTGSKFALSPVITASLLNSVINPSQTGFITGALGLSNVQLVSNLGLTYPSLDTNGSVPLSQLGDLLALGGGVIT